MAYHSIRRSTQQVIDRALSALVGHARLHLDTIYSQDHVPDFDLRECVSMYV